MIYLHHPVLFDSTYFVAQSNKSLAFEFWKRGYDVWMGNARGTTHSKTHESLQHTDSEFWNFTYMEWGYYDTYAAVKYINDITKKKVIFLGVSGGANAGIVFSATRPKMASELLSMVVAVTPVLITSHVDNAFYFLRPLVLALKVLFTNSISNNLRKIIFRNGTIMLEFMVLSLSHTYGI